MIGCSKAHLCGPNIAHNSIKIWDIRKSNFVYKKGKIIQINSDIISASYV